jgi:hypothetical protein
VLRPRTTIKYAGALLVALGLGTACSGGSSVNPSTNPTGPYAAEIKQAMTSATTDFERQVLQDGKITRAEYEEAVSRYLACTEAHGVKMSKNLNPAGYYTYAQPGMPDKNPWIMKCGEGTSLYIGSLYISMLRNPGHLNEADVMAECLVRKHLAPAGYQGKDLSKDQGTSFKGAPFSDTDPRYGECFDNPSAP